MKQYLLKNSLVLGIGLILITALTPSASNTFAQRSLQNSNTQNSLPKLSEQEIRSVAQNITIKIRKKDGLWGSGVLVKQEKRGGQTIYTIATAAHVVRNRQAVYDVETSDRKIHKAQLLDIKFGNTDLALLKFTAVEFYQVASLKPAFSLAILDNKTEAFASGYPIEAIKGFVFQSGKISALLPNAIDLGYQIGFSTEIEQGMSGGALLNAQGELIGIIGKKSMPPIGYPNAYLSQDGSPPIAPKMLMMSSSWAIPIEVLVAKSLTKLPLTLAWDSSTNITVAAVSEQTSLKLPENTNNPQNSPENTNNPQNFNSELSLPPSFVTDQQYSEICKEVVLSLGNNQQARLTCKNNKSNPQESSLVLLLENSNNIANKNTFPIQISDFDIDNKNLSSKNLEINNLERKNNANFLISFRYGNKPCSFKTILYIVSYDQKSKFYKKSKAYSSENSEYLIKDLNGDGLMEIFMNNYSCHFSAKYPQGIKDEDFPITIYRYDNLELRDVTTSPEYQNYFKSKAQKIAGIIKANKNLKNYANIPTEKRNELKLLLAGYLVNQYRANNLKEGWVNVTKWYKFKDSQMYFNDLQKLLKEAGYTE